MNFKADDSLIHTRGHSSISKHLKSQKTEGYFTTTFWLLTTIEEKKVARQMNLSWFGYVLILRFNYKGQHYKLVAAFNIFFPSNFKNYLSNNQMSSKALIPTSKKLLNSILSQNPKWWFNILIS